MKKTRVIIYDPNARHWRTIAVVHFGQAKCMVPFKLINIDHKPTKEEAISLVKELCRDIPLMNNRDLPLEFKYEEYEEDELSDMCTFY